MGDSYHDSLVYTNLLLIQLFGKEDRKVPAHMPHFLNRQNLDKIESKIRPYFDSTSSHRFRQSDDLQYSFMYFHFLKVFEMEKKQEYYDSLWSRYLDTDHDGILSSNELRTLASIVYKDDINDEQGLNIVNILGISKNCGIASLRRQKQLKRIQICITSISVLQNVEGLSHIQNILEFWNPLY